MSDAPQARERVDVEGLTLADAFELGYCWRGQLIGQTLEDSRAVGRTLQGPGFDRLKLDLSGFNSFESADLGVCDAKRRIFDALNRADAPLKAAVEEERKLVAVHKGLSDGKSLVISQLEAAVEEARGALEWIRATTTEAGTSSHARSALAKLPALNAATLSGETAWQPIATAPRDGTRIDLRKENVVALNCSWSLCDIERSPNGLYDWAMAPTGFQPTHWRPAADHG